MSSDRLAERQEKKVRKKGCGIMLTLALLGFILLAVPTVCYLFFITRAARLVEVELAEIRAAGEPATAEELDAYYEYPPIKEDATQLWLAATKPFDGETYEEACGELPIVGDSEEDKIIPPPGEEWEDLEAVEVFLAKYTSSLELMHQAMEKGGAARYPLDFSKGWEMLMPDIQGFREGARVLSLQAHVRARQGDTHGAAESIRAMIKVVWVVKAPDWVV